MPPTLKSPVTGQNQRRIRSGSVSASHSSSGSAWYERRIRTVTVSPVRLTSRWTALMCSRMSITGGSLSS